MCAAAPRADPEPAITWFVVAFVAFRGIRIALAHEAGNTEPRYDPG